MAAARKKKQRKKKKKKPTQASLADPHLLYERSVQEPEVDLEFVRTTFRKHRKRAPRILREDFCGTAWLSCEWVRGHHRRRAIAVDLDAPTLEWARAHNLAKLGDKASRRIRLVEGDVREPHEPAADVTCAFNFSFCVLKQRRQLREYFESVHRGLADDGIFFLDLYGGTESMVELKEDKKVDGFTYRWHQRHANPINNDFLAHIDFKFKDGSKLKRAFTYDWRLWTLPEVRDLLEESGFPTVEVYWEEEDKKGEATGEYRLVEEVENQEAWVAFVAALK